MKHAALASKLREVLLRENPMGIYFDDVKNTDEYDSEIEAIIQRFSTCTNQAQVQRMIWNVFKEFFGEQGAGPKSQYAKLAEIVWSFVNKQQL